MNRCFQISSFIIATLLSGCVGAGSLQAFSSQSPSQLILEGYKEPSPEANLMYRILVAELAGKRGQFDVALENYRIAARLSDDPRVAERGLSIARYMDDATASLEMSRRWYALAPDDLQARQILALSLLRNDLLEEALPHLDAILLATAGDNQQGFTTLYHLLTQVEGSDISQQVMQHFRERHPRSKFALYYYALAAREAEDYTSALESLETALEVDPQWGQAYLLRAQVMMDKGNSEAALAALAESVAKLPADKPLREGYARLLIGAGRLSEARQQFQILAEQNPQDADPLYALGLLAAEAEEFDQAIAYFEQVLQRGKRIMETYYELGKLEELRGNYPQAREWYARVSNDERYFNAQIRIGLTFAKTGDFTAMNDHFTELRQNNPRNTVPLYISEAEILREEERYQAAFDLLTRALAHHPDDSDLLYTRALVAERLDRLDILERDLRHILEQEPDNGHALNALGYTLADRTDRYQEALDYLKRAIELLPDDAAVLDSMGWVHYRLGNYEKSLDYLRRAYELQADPEIAAHLTEVLWINDQKDEALNIWRQSFEENPESEYLLKVKEKFNL